MALAEKLLAARVQPPRPRDRRPPHLRLPRRRLPDGRHLARGLRRSPARSALGKLIALLRRQRHLDRRQGRRGWFTDDTPQALRGLRLARDRRTSTATTSRRSTRAIAQGASASSDRPTLICCKTIIGKGAPNKAGTGDGARRGARRRGGRRDARGARLAAPAVRDPGGDLRRLGRARARRAAPSRRGTRCFAPTQPRIPSWPPSSSGACAGELPADFDARSLRRVVAAADAKAETVATRKASQNGARGARRRRCRS